MESRRIKKGTKVSFGASIQKGDAYSESIKDQLHTYRLVHY